MNKYDWGWLFLGFLVVGATAWAGWVALTAPYPDAPPTFTRAQLDAEYRAGLTEGAKRATLDAQRCQCGYRQFLGELCRK